MAHLVARLAAWFAGNGSAAQGINPASSREVSVGGALRRLGDDVVDGDVDGDVVEPGLGA
jgi:hypothetical protein